MFRNMILLLAMVAWAGQSWSADPFNFLPLEDAATSEVVAANTGDTAIGSYSWDSAEKTDGNVSLKINFTSTAGWSYQLNINTLSGGAYAPTDLSSYQYIAFDLYGDGSGKNLYFKFFDAGGNSVYLLPTIDFTGWKHFHVARSSFNAENGSAATLWTDLIGLTLSDPAGGPMTIQLDNLVATNSPAPSLAAQKTAANRTITVDGDVSDWDLGVSQVSTVDNSARGLNMSAQVAYAWDASYLYILVQETGASSASQEAASAVDYAGGPWGYDGVALWIDLVNAGGVYSVNPWMGFSSTGQAGLWIARVDNTDATLTSAPLANGSVATGGAFAARDRVIEAAISWADLAASVGASYQPAGGLAAAVAADFTFGCEPLLIENDWNGQSFIGGSQYIAPTGNDTNSVDVVLSSEVPATLSAFELE